MERITIANMEYKTKFLRKLWEYENTGHQPHEITPKEGSPAALNVKPQQKHKIRLIVGSTIDGLKNRYYVQMDGEELTLEKFGERIGVKGNAIRSWCRYDTFDKNVREKGLV